MGFASILTFAHQLAAQAIRLGDIAIDATVGNGNDTLFLAQQVGSAGKVYGFDIQEQALARARLKQESAVEAARAEASARSAPGSVHWLNASHHLMDQFIPGDEQGRIAAVMFNLGYLPGADHHVITRSATTIPAISAALRLLRKDGIVTIVLYPGHPGGQEEAEAVSRFAEQLPQTECQALQYRFVNQHHAPPQLIALCKRQTT